MRKTVFFICIILLYSFLNAQTRPQGDGLIGDYYQGYAFDSLGVLDMSELTLSFSRVDTNFDIWNGSQYYAWQPVSGWGNNYSVEWNGYIYIEETGRYGFGTISDDGSQILIDDEMIMNNGESQWYDWEDNISEGSGADTIFTPLILNSGFHKITIKFAEWGSYDGIEVWWIKPSEIDSSDIPWYGENFHGVAPYFNPNTNWEILPKAVLYTSVNMPPIAFNDSVNVNEDSLVVFYPLNNDYDPDSSTIYIAAYETPLNGTITLLNDSTFSYQPKSNFFGNDSFHYFIKDDFGQLDSAIVLITVKNTPDMPSYFSLLAPADSFVTVNNDWNVTFLWNHSEDADNDSLNYYLNIFNESSDTTINVFSDTSFTFDGASFFNEGLYYNWTVWANDKNFTVYADTFSFYVSLLVSVTDNQTLSPLVFRLDQNFPNPFNPLTVINYQLSMTSDVELSVYNILGEKITTLVKNRQKAGHYEVTLDASSMSSGIYFYQVSVNGRIADTKKMTLIK